MAMEPWELELWIVETYIHMGAGNQTQVLERTASVLNH